MTKAALILTLGLVLSACSTVKIFYGFADDFIQREVADHLDLDEQDEALLRDQTADLVAWHRREMLPRYAMFLNSQADRIERGDVTRAQITASFEQARRLLEQTVAGMAPRAGIILARHSGPAKLAHLERRLAERMADRLERLDGPRVERIKRRSERLVTNFERFFGDLDGTQVAIIERHVTETLDDSRRFYAHRQRREATFIAFLGQRPGAKTIAPFFENLLVRSHQVVEPDYKSFADERARKFQNLLFKIVSSLTPGQRKDATKRLRSLAEDFTDLSKPLF